MKQTIIIAATLTAIAATARADSDTPYSMYGYGILGDRATSMQRQMGGTGYAMRGGRQVNVMNPASYAAADSMNFIFDMGADVALLWSKEGAAKERSTGGGLDYVCMEFPLGKYVGASVGLVPYSSVGYAFGNDVAHGTVQNQGSGGINELYAGVGAGYKGFSVGVNVSYDFGNIVNDVFTNPAQGSTKFEHVMEVRDWNIVAGVQYGFRFAKTESLTFGVTYSPKKTLLGKSWVTEQELKQESTPTEVGRLPLKGNYYLPNSIGAGVAYTHERVSRLSVELDYTWQGWSDAGYSAMKSLSNPDAVVFEGMKFNNRERFAAGAEFIPKTRGNYGQRISYRLGAYYTKDYLNIRGNGVREYGVTGGFGFPTPEGKTMVNLGFEWKHRQAHPNPLISENYLNITLGVNFNEVWFFKRKIR